SSTILTGADSSPVAGAVPAADVDSDGAAAGIASAEESLIDPEATAEAEVDGDTETGSRLEPEALSQAPVEDDDIPAAQRVDYDPDEVWLSADDAAASWDTALTDAEIAHREVAHPEIANTEIANAEIVNAEIVNTAIADDSPWQLVLDRDTYNARYGDTLTLTGVVQWEAAANPEAIAPQLALWVLVRDPQTAQPLIDRHHFLPLNASPQPFEVEITVPTTDQTRLFLGELSLVARETMAGAAAITVLATQAFSITADLNALLEAIANDFGESDEVRPPLEFLKDVGNANLSLAFLNLVETPKPLLNLQPTDTAALPPQLYQPNPAKARTKIDLPFSAGGATSALGQALAMSMGAVTSRSDSSVASPDAAVSADADQESSVADGDTAPALEDAMAAIAHQETGTEPGAVPDTAPEPEPQLEPEPEALWETLSTDVDLSLADILREERPSSAEMGLVPHSPPAPEQQAFQALNLRNRFWSRLNALATDTEVTDWLQRVDPIDPLPQRDAPLGLDTRLASNEIVVDDDIPLPQQPAQPFVYSPPRVTKAESLQPAVSADEPIPLPEINIIGNPLVAGKTISLVVKLPDVGPRIYVKLWANDRQTRSLIDGPRWLVNFLPDRTGKRETWVHLTVPFGCLEIQFEAIAIEMSTQRESEKVSVECDVVPADAPPSSELLLDDFQ
ncbi:MAG TPA: hypothetical protein V6C88_17940, partial [Chroococcidiopsis sp.]